MAHRLGLPCSVKSSWTRDRTHVPCIGLWILYHWTTRQVLDLHFEVQSSTKSGAVFLTKETREKNMLESSRKLLMQLKLQELKFWKEKPQSPGLTLCHFLHPGGHCWFWAQTGSSQFRLSVCGGRRKTGKVFWGELRGFKPISGFPQGWSQDPHGKILKIWAGDFFSLKHRDDISVLTRRGSKEYISSQLKIRGE